RIPVLTQKIPRYLARGSWTGHAGRFGSQLPVCTAMRLLKRFEPGSCRARSRDRFAAGAKRRYRTSMKISRLLLAIVFAAAASLLATDELTERLQPALEAITPDGLLAHIKVLASDEFEGRAPGTKGEELSVKYINDQYKKVDVRGKTLLMLIGDPPVPDPKDPSKLDEKMFKGKAMTYYGRWTYKYEIAAQKRAAAAIIIHETEPAAYPWQVVRSSWGKENFELDNPNKNMDTVEARSWITLDTAKKLLADCGQNFDALKKSALTKEFHPVSLKATAYIEIKQQIRSFKSHNVIGK